MAKPQPKKTQPLNSLTQTIIVAKVKDIQQVATSPAPVSFFHKHCAGGKAGQLLPEAVFEKAHRFIVWACFSPVQVSSVLHPLPCRGW